MMTWRIFDVLVVVVVVRILARASLGGAERRLTTCVECPKLELAGTAAMCKSTDHTGARWWWLLLTLYSFFFRTPAPFLLCMSMCLHSAFSRTDECRCSSLLFLSAFFIAIIIMAYFSKPIDLASRPRGKSLSPSLSLTSPDALPKFYLSSILLTD